MTDRENEEIPELMDDEQDVANDEGMDDEEWEDEEETSSDSER